MSQSIPSAPDWLELTVDGPNFRQVMGRYPTGVTVLTTIRAGQPVAMTANSIMSVSVDPLLMLACVERAARFHEAVLAAGVWGVSILPARAQPSAAWLATRGRPTSGMLDDVPHRIAPLTGVALLDESLGAMECRTAAVYPGGDHSIIVADVLSLHLAQDEEPALLYHRGRYGVAP
jgi:flavin reductase